MKAVLPDALAAAVKAEADRRGMTIIDFFGHLASEATGVPYEFEEPLSLSA